eukprot:1706240-Pleurochrysis_carterae.AAC.1
MHGLRLGGQGALQPVPLAEERVVVRHEFGVSQDVAEHLAVRLLPPEHAAHVLSRSRRRHWGVGPGVAQRSFPSSL